MGADKLDLAAVPFTDGISCEDVEVLMIAVHEGHREGEVLQQGQLDIVPAVSVPYRSKIARNYGNI